MQKANSQTGWSRISIRLPGATGCIYAMRRALAAPLPAGCLLDDVHLPMLAFLAGYRLILEENAKAFDVSTTLDTEFRRKVRTQAGVYQILFAFPQLLWASNRMWFHFMSHKVARLLLPFAILIALVSSFALPGIWARLAVAGEALFFASIARLRSMASQRFLSARTQFAGADVRDADARYIVRGVDFGQSPASRFWSASTQVGPK